MKTLQVKWAILLALSIFVCFFATLNLYNSPGVWLDEGVFIEAALNLSRFGELATQIAPHEFISAGFVTVGYPVIAPVAASFFLFGEGLLEARWVAVLYIFLVVAAGYFFLTKVSRSRDALLGTLLFATSPSLYGLGKNVLGEVPGTAWLLLALYFFYEMERRPGKILPVLFAGGMIGLTLVSKPTFLPLIFAVCVVLAVRRNVLHITLLRAVSFFAPLAGLFTLWVVTQFRGDSLKGVISHYSNPQSVNFFDAVWKNIVDALTNGTTLLVIVCGIAWLSALIIQKRNQQHISAAELLGFIFFITLSAAYLQSAGYYRYFFPIQALGLLLLPYNARIIWDQFGTPRLAGGISLVLMCLVLFQIYTLSFHSWIANSYTSTRTRLLHGVLSNLDPQSSVLLYHAPELAILIPQHQYAQYLDIAPNIQKGIDNKQRVSEGSFDIVIAPQALVVRDKALFKYYIPAADIDRYVILSHEGLALPVQEL